MSDPCKTLHEHLLLLSTHGDEWTHLPWHLSEAADVGESFAMRLSLPCPPPFVLYIYILYRFQRSTAEKTPVTPAMGIYGA